MADTNPESIMKEIQDFSPVQLQEVRDAINQRLIIENEAETLSQSANQSADTPAQKFEAQHINNDPVATSSAMDAPVEPADRTAPHDPVDHTQNAKVEPDDGINKEDTHNLNEIQRREVAKAHQNSK